MRSSPVPAPSHLTHHASPSTPTTRLDALRSRVRDAEDRVVEYKKQNQIITAGGLLVNEQLRVADDVHEKDMRNLQAELHLSVVRHSAMLANHTGVSTSIFRRHGLQGPR